MRAPPIPPPASVRSPVRGSCTILRLAPARPASHTAGMRRRRVIAGLVVVALAVGLTVWLWPRPTGPRLATFQQVQPGMTRAEVYDALGGPPGDYTDLGFTYAVPSHRTEFWVANDGMLTVKYGDDGRVAKATTEPLALSRSRFWARLRARLGL